MHLHWPQAAAGAQQVLRYNLHALLLLLMVRCGCISVQFLAASDY
jgi:hypothetical protein